MKLIRKTLIIGLFILAGLIGKSQQILINEGDQWIVLSDRPENALYSNRSCTANNGLELGFKDIAYVVEQTNTSLRVVLPESVMGSNLKTNWLENSGWIKRANVALSREALKINNIPIIGCSDNVNYRKALVVTQMDNMSETPVFYDSPTGGNTGAEIGLAQIYYVLKDEASRLLLSEVHILNNPVADRNYVQGWVDKSLTLPWNHPVALEPNTIKSAFQQFGSGYKARVFKDRNAALSKNNYIIHKDNVNTDVLYEAEYDLSPNTYLEEHMVILEALSNNLYKVGVVGGITIDQLTSDCASTVCQDGEIEIPANILTEIKRGLEEKCYSCHNVNIIFVIDATSSILSYSQAIQEAIRNSMNALQSSILDYNVNFGVLLYRDAAEGTNNNALATSEVNGLNNIVQANRRLTQNVNEINNFVGQNMVEQYNRFDTDHEESVYFGISKAIEHFDPPQSHSNFIVLIGDAGNHNREIIRGGINNGEEDFTVIEHLDLINDLNERKINLVSIQANHRQDQYQESYDSFRVQTEKLMHDLVGKVYENIDNQDELFENVQIANDIMGIKTKRQTGFSHYQFLPAPGQSISTGNLQLCIESTANDISSNFVCSDGVNYVYDVLCNYISTLCGCNCNNLNFKDQVAIRNTAHWITMSLCALNEDEIENAPDQVVAIGYTKADIWQYDLYYSKDNLGSIKRSIERLIPTDDNGLTANEYRSYLLNTWKDILIEKGIPETTIDGLTLGESSCILTGYGGDKFNEYLLREIVDPSIFSDEELYRYLVDWLFTKGYVQSYFEGKYLLGRDFFEDHYWTIINEYKCYLTNYENCEELDYDLINTLVEEANRYRFIWRSNCGVDGDFRFCPTMRIPIGQESGHVYYWMDTRVFPHSSSSDYDPDRVNECFSHFINN
ncbi:MAG: hypothetical protein HN778_14220 [Prolixibacteraceae bacterium]|nr:hypothetical protein [Prolixibacteraceae bacterium]MBT6767261.1 hypothetical protein [Prolixibacteraceae bacterium]MBT6999169.1 hypothetical protein [Prolixibacteraceae bacterium]MBT7395982.1 hypothetical protein [Prolixibacteraceae bacterium]